MTDFIDKVPADDSNSTNGLPTPAASGEHATPAIEPGKISKLSVPREDIAAEIRPSEELVSPTVIEIRKITKERYVQLNRESEMTTRLLVHKPKPDSFDEDYYYVSPELRHDVQDLMKDVRVSVFYSVDAKVYGLWIAKVNPGLSRSESLERLFSMPAEFFKVHEVKITAEKVNSRYKVKFRPAAVACEWPCATTEELLGAALGEDHFIRSAEHPLYVELAGGEEL